MIFFFIQETRLILQSIQTPLNNFIKFINNSLNEDTLNIDFLGSYLTFEEKRFWNEFLSNSSSKKRVKLFIFLLHQFFL